jgi:glycosyltransferase involved in cell wall biosynthesis
MNREEQPKISCLTVTLNRLILLKEAIQCFCHQTYANKELVIVTDGNQRYADAIRDYIATLDGFAIRLLQVEGKNHPLGRLRNIAMDFARGRVLCQWDDDDLVHPERLQTQFDHMARHQARACFLTDQLQFFVQQREMYWVTWTGNEGFIHQLIPGTLMMVKSPFVRYPETGRFARTGEDSALLHQVIDQMKTVGLSHSGYLYIYRYHGNNVFSRQHHMKMARFGLMATDVAMQYRAQLQAALNYYRLPRPYVLKTA